MNWPRFSRALRYWQQDLAANEEGPISDHFTNCTPLTVDEIDDLCERINCGPSANPVG